uniref:Uncharacterized protein n=1 Tax=Parascaris univalens TaxID=6257 RepID=A0A915BJH3_PARUN
SGMSDMHRLGNMTPKIEVDASMSLYEDALDESDIELNNIYTDALRYMKKQQKRKRSKRQKPIQFPHPTMAVPTRRSNSQPLQSSSSEHSSIEQIFCDDRGQIKSKQGTTPRSDKRAHKSGASAASSGSSGEWKLVSVTEANTYSMLMQLNQQLQFISRQLYEMETTNTLQLRLMYRIANESAKRKKQTAGKLLSISMMAHLPAKLHVHRSPKCGRLVISLVNIGGCRRIGYYVTLNTTPPRNTCS